MRILRRVLPILVSFLVGSIFPLPAQTPLALNEKLTIGPDITMGKLENGLTYYIRVNKKPENRAELRLAVRTGSVMEDDDQLGLAHFTEHMAFNGTKSFPKNEIINLLEKEGIRLGPDVNAYTSFDQTVYMLQIPMDSAALVKKAFQILEEWAHAITFDGTEIDKERGVLVEEWRLGRGAFQRVLNKHLPTLLYKSKYADRFVIGKKEILETAPHSVLKRFYNDWYRPELMAVVAVGDFDKTEIERIIKERFAPLTNRRPARERTEYTLTDHDNALASVAVDKELPMTTATVYFKRPLFDESTVGGYRISMIQQLYDGMFNKRLQERLQQPDPPFVNGYGYDSRWIGHRRAYQLNIMANEKKINEGLSYIVSEAYRVREHGFTATELEREKTNMLRSMEQAFKERDKTESQQYADEYLRNFLENEPIPGIAKEYDIYKQLLPGISLQEVNSQATIRLTEKNRVVVLSAPEKEGLVVPQKEELLKTVLSAAAAKTTAYVDKVSTQPLISALPPPGSIVKENTISSIGVTEWTLSNGAKVVLKPTDFKNDEILFSLYSDGGTSLSSDPDFVSASISSGIVSMSGVGSFDGTALRKMLTGKVANVYPIIGVLSEGMSGNASPQDAETLFQLAYLYATSPRTDTSAFSALMARQRAAIENRSVSPEGAFYDTVSVTMAQYHHRARPFTKELLNEVDLNNAITFYKERFADASDFVIFLVGNFTLDSMKPLVNKYLASLPSLKRGDRWRDVNMQPPTGVVKKEVFRGMEPKSSVMMTFTGRFEWNGQARYDFNSLLELMNIKLREVVREEKSGTYGIGASGSPSKYPRQEYQVTVNWGCNPDRAQELITTVLQQIDSLKITPPSLENVNKVKEIQRRNLETNMKENRYWMSQFRQFYANGENPEAILDMPKSIDGLTAIALQAAAKKYLDVNNYATFVLFPEKKQ